MLTESDDLDILGVTFDSKMTFEKHHLLAYRAASQMLGIMSCRDSAVWSLSAHTHLNGMDHQKNFYYSTERKTFQT